jgi:hypothetical protein
MLPASSTRLGGHTTTACIFGGAEGVKSHGFQY